MSTLLGFGREDTGVVRRSQTHTSAVAGPVTQLNPKGRQRQPCTQGGVCPLKVVATSEFSGPRSCQMVSFFLDFCQYVSKSYQIIQFVRKRKHHQPTNGICVWNDTASDRREPGYVILIKALPLWSTLVSSVVEWMVPPRTWTWRLWGA